MFFSEDFSDEFSGVLFVWKHLLIVFIKEDIFSWNRILLYHLKDS